MIKIPTLKNKKLQKLAFVHRSYLNEAEEKLSSNERLEFLGDSILSFVVSKYLFKKYPNFEEGTLTNLRAKLVNTKILSEVARHLNLGHLLFLSKGEEAARGRQNPTILANSFEAFIGALFIDQGIEKVEEFLGQVLLLKADLIVKSRDFKDPKSILQEKFQSQGKGSPIYKVLGEEGPSHSKTFTVGVFIENKELARGEGRSKQQAEQKAAQQALDLV